VKGLNGAFGISLEPVLVTGYLSWLNYEAGVCFLFLSTGARR
jgi:hypothetical protein